MTEAARQQELINTLKAFNNAVVSIRLYPPNAPQIGNAFERGYKTLKNHLRQEGDFSLAVQDDIPVFCGNPIEPEVVQSIANLIVFRQLVHLQKERFVLKRGVDRAAFKKILNLFSTKVDQIKKEGGGWALIQKLGMENYFPEEDAAAVPAKAEPAEHTRQPRGTVLIGVRREFIDVLLGRERRPGIIKELQMTLRNPEAGAPVLAAAAKGVLDGLVQKKSYTNSAAFEQLIENSGKVTPHEQRAAVYDQAIQLLLNELDAQSSMLLFCQDLKRETGSIFIQMLLSKVPLDRFVEVIRDIRQRVSHVQVTQAGDEQQLQFLRDAESRLLESPKGRQFQGQEKAKSIIQAGEKARRAKRAEAGVKALLKGSQDVLRSEEFNVHLPFVVQRMLADGLAKEVRVLLKRLVDSYLGGDEVLKHRAIRPISQIAENLIQEGNWAGAGSLAEPLLNWLKTSEDGDFVYEKCCVVLQKLMGHGWRSGDVELGDNILSVFYQIRSGMLKKTSGVRALVGRNQDKGVDHGLLAHLLQECLSNPKDEVISRRLILQGPLASRYLVDSLIRADVTTDRMKILDLLTQGEQYLPEILIEKLAEPMPWYGKRNLLKLLSETGGTEHLDTVYQFFHHDDLRVQREAFVCLYKISGKSRKKALLHALTEASETMKLQIVRALIPFADAEVAAGLSQLLEEYNFYSVEFRDTLLANTCLAIARCPYPDSEKALLNFLELKGKRPAKKIGARVWQTAQNALKIVEEDYVGERQLKAKASKLRKSVISRKAGSGQKAQTTRKSITGLSDERMIRELIDLGDQERAKGLLLELIGKIARLRRFAQAEQLREWLIEIDSLALTDIIRAAEIIEEEKHAAVDKEHLETWSGLFDVLSTEEFSAFYHALDHRRFNNEEMIMKRGATQKALFFINSGRIKLFYQEKDAEVLIKTLHKGQILGIGTFFNSSVWTVNAVALGQTEASILTYDRMLQWREEFPALESKLHDFCTRFESVSSRLAQEGKDRREHKRHKVAELRISVNLLDKDGKSTGVSAKGDMFDISRGGLSFFMRISKKDNARLLLGRNLKVMVPAEQVAGGQIAFVGEITAVRAHHAMENEYSVHVQFDKTLDGAEMQRLLRVI